MTNDENKMTAVICSPGKEARIAEIGTSLEDMQKVVGGYIEPFYFTDEDEVLIICNEEGKFNGMRPCRAVYDDEGQMQDIVFGCFFITAYDDEGFCSLTPELAEKYSKQFQHAELFFRTAENTIVAEPIIEKPKARTI